MTGTIGSSCSTGRFTVAVYEVSRNIASWAGREYRYDPFNMLWQTKPTTGNGVSFLYGPGDERLWTIDWTAGSAPSNWRETWTLRDLDGTPLRQFRTDGGNTAAANWSFHRDYVYRGGALLATHTPEGLRHFHLDHLGSPRIITNSNAATLAQHLYFPFGEEATNPTQDDEALKYTGHERDDLDPGGTTADLDYMHARYFSAHLGRFQSPDPIGAALTWPQSWNRYSYVLGNPVKYYDPEGLWPFLFPLGDLPIATIDGDPITVTTTGIPLGFLNFLGFGSFLRNLGFLNELSSPSTRYSLFQRLHERTDVQRFFACMGRKSFATDFEAGGLIQVTPSGDLAFSMRLGEKAHVQMGDVSGPTLVGVAHTHQPTGPLGFVPQSKGKANDLFFAVNTKGFGDSRVPNYIIHPRGGVTRFLSGLDTTPGTQVLPSNFDRGMRDVCKGIGSF